MLYHILCHDKPGSLQTRLDNREAHLAVVNALGDRLFAAGPLLNANEEMIGSVLIIDFDSDTAAQTFCEQDPYAQAGLFEQVTVTRWRKTLPA
ncbi:MAG: YciI family protein [Halieaceae bacterium]